MDIRYAVSPEHARTFDTEQIRDRFLVRSLFETDKVSNTYSVEDRMLVMGVCPAKQKLSLEVGPEITGTDFLLERRELGTINLGGPGLVAVDGERHEVDKYEGVYVGAGARELVFESASAAEPAKFYTLSGPSHASYPTKKFGYDDANHVELGSDAECNRRTIHQYIHQNGVKSSNLVMGYTTLSPGSVWNTMPCHTHLRRMEIYCYFDLPEGARVFHFMGEPTQTRHVLMNSDEAIICPAWSIHSGVGTREYSFVWAMLGENQRFDDMDAVKMEELK